MRDFEFSTRLNSDVLYWKVGAKLIQGMIWNEGSLVDSKIVQLLNQEWKILNWNFNEIFIDETGPRTAFIHDLEGNGRFDVEEDTMFAWSKVNHKLCCIYQDVQANDYCIWWWSISQVANIKCFHLEKNPPNINLPFDLEWMYP